MYQLYVIFIDKFRKMFFSLLGLVGFATTYIRNTRKPIKIDLQLTEALEERIKSGSHKGDKRTKTGETMKEKENLMSYKLTELQDREVPVTITSYDVKPTVVPSVTPSSGEMTESEARRRAWENGQVDYLGVDSFDNIMRKLNESMDCSPSYNVHMPL